MTSNQHILLRRYFVNSLRFSPPGWNPGDVEYFRGEPGTPDLSDAIWWPVKPHSSAALRMVSYECESVKAARSFLLDLLGEFQLPGIKRFFGSNYESKSTGDVSLSESTGDVPLSESTGDVPLSESIGDVALSESTGDVPLSESIGDVAFSGPGELVILFARANLVVLIQNARATFTPVLPFAREIDAEIQRNPGSTGDELIEMDQLYLPDCEFHVGDEIPIQVKQQCPLDEEPLYKFFAAAGELFIRGDQVVYRPATAGIQSIVAFAQKAGKSTARQVLTLSAEPQTNPHSHAEKERLKSFSLLNHNNTMSVDPEGPQVLDSNNLEKEEKSAMSHNMIGKWSSIFPSSDDEQTDLKKDGQIEITEINNFTGQVRGFYTDSDEVRVRLEGYIGYAGHGSYTVTLWHRIQPGLNRLYEGQLATADEGDHPHYIVAGRYRSVQETSTVESGPAPAAESGQDNGTWIATKP